MVNNFSFFDLHEQIRKTGDILAIESFTANNTQIEVTYTHANDDETSTLKFSTPKSKYLNKEHLERYKKAIKSNVDFWWKLDKQHQTKIVGETLFKWQMFKFIALETVFWRYQYHQWFLEELEKTVLIDKDIRGAIKLEKESSKLNAFCQSHARRLIRCSIHLLICCGQHKSLCAGDLISVTRNYLSCKYRFENGAIYLDLSGKLDKVPCTRLQEILFLNASRQTVPHNLNLEVI